MLRFKISNMTCGGCAEGVVDTVREVDPNAVVETNVEQREISVETKAADADTLDRALRDAGWKSERQAA
ncbi:heavy-metal-associated domain-containing protein [Pseudoroseomonas ludipueritiae]|uniref:heavy-metal-associated domain-containing protein n=1 Tax=Pseudoroseomonas ludipueritiae TaxID=198093 RepID=UPI001933CF54|nr:heavy-metal-associated domain-containing protein [Pseudoroseomonas ludipueritiae]MCG7361292.1 heavy-metal-associated domain-containing protein [Roseomonas sp. ACRSG]